MAQPTILTVQEVAAYLRLHAVTVYRMAQNGDLPAFRVGRRWRFKLDQIEQWVSDHQAANSAIGPANNTAGRPGAGRARSGRK
ncbi:MAG TPA: helix-turn-helix domain-containing protein [bacterium]|nr:helix-turn-helix domain-containing protein [bacterium]